ncbi:type IV leader peptidase family protein [Paraburkholderia fungorum]|jgi:prepilin peptidase CpaA|uniref:Type IV leader peptidase family protein n=1 Tax=Paraburkholderia fungorum TaxID=134537 RepID=A0AAU8TII3_9BURK|nr:prepilin peptidase [Paraburkholderia fungorum]AJZ60471.1 type IV leader peptidase family protein [Paraburkholderia fungorum]
MNVSVGILLFIAWAAVVAVSDCRSRRISNSVVVAGLVAAFGCAFLQCGPFGVSLTQAGIGVVVGLAALLPFFAFGVMGAADVKVFAVLGAWCGMHALLGLWMAASFAAAVHALWLLITTRTRLAGLLRSHGVTFELAGKPSTPYAACLTAAASVWLVLQGLAGGLR